MSSSDEMYQASPPPPLREKKPAPKSKKQAQPLGSSISGGSKVTNSSSTAIKRNKQVTTAPSGKGGPKKTILDPLPEDRPMPTLTIARHRLAPSPSRSTSTHAHVTSSSAAASATGLGIGSIERRRANQNGNQSRMVVNPICISDDEEEQGPGSGSGGYDKKARMEIGFDDGEESDGDGLQIADVLNQLGSQLMSRQKAKRRRLQDCFTSVKQCPNMLVETLQNHSMERSKVVAKFQDKSNEIVKQVDELYELQKQTEDKLSKMQLYLVKNFTSMKESLSTCVTGLKDIIKQFDQETSQLQGQHDEESKNQLSKMDKELAALQNKLLRDGKNEEVEAIQRLLIKRT